MSNPRIFALSFFVAAILLIPSQAVDAYVPQVSTVQSAKDPITEATVNLYCRLRHGKRTYLSTGSGVVIGERGIVLTNAHVAQYFLLTGEEARIKGRCVIRAGSPAKELYTARVLYLPQTWLLENDTRGSKEKLSASGSNDYALLQITGHKNGSGDLPRFRALSIDLVGAVAEKDTVMVAGYPSEDMKFNDIAKKLKFITASSTVVNVVQDYGEPANLISLRASSASREGISGGPVLNQSNVVVGIATSKSTSENNPTLRAITTTYINKALLTQTGLTLHKLISGDPEHYQYLSHALYTPEVAKIVRNNLIRGK